VLLQNTVKKEKGIFSNPLSRAKAKARVDSHTLMSFANEAYKKRL
jgi:hypothetical protein